MEKLIKAYLAHTDHYLEGNEIRRIDPFIRHDEQHYQIEIVDRGDYRGYENVEISNSDLLTFLFERTL